MSSTAEHFEKVAVVGAPRWEQWCVDVAAAFVMSGELRTFDRERLDAAWQWVRAQKTTMRIAISGAGVAGPALAHWLHRTGHTPTLIEQAPKFRTGGYVIDFWGVGYQVAKRMGIEQPIRDAGYQIAVRCAPSAPTARSRPTWTSTSFARMLGDDFTSLPRGDLAAAIYATIEDDVETIFGDSIAAIDEHRRCPPDLRRRRSRAISTSSSAPTDCIRTCAVWSFGPEADFEHYLGCQVAAFVVDGYRPRDELVYVTYNTPGRQVARFALRDDRTMFLFMFRAEHDSDRRWHQKTSCATSSATPAGNARTSWRRSTMSTICTSMSSARSGWTLVARPSAADRRCGRMYLAARRRGHRPGDDRGLRAGRRTRARRRRPSPRLRCLRGAAASLHREQAGRCGRSSSRSSPRGPDSACGSATWRCAR